jgi:acyl-CoA thioesterase-1
MTDKRICFLGDSFTLGQGDPAGLGWPGRVLASALAEGQNLTAYNLGVRGDTAAQVALRAKAETDARFRSGDAKAVVFSFGTNDLSLERPLEETLEALDALLEWAGAEGYAAFVLPPPTFLEGGPAYRAGIMTDAFADSCHRYGAPFLDTRTAGIDWASWWGEARAGDGIHPAAGAYESLARAFCEWDAWKVWLRS